MIEGISWQWIFWLNVPVGLALVPLAISRLRESHGPEKALDLPGLALASAGLLGVVWGLVNGNGDGWSSLDRRVARLGVSAARRLRPLGLGPRSRCSRCAFPQPRLRGCERRVARDVVRDVRLDLPADAVLPNRARLLAARGGPRVLPWTAMPMVVAPIAGALSEDRLAADPRDQARRSRPSGSRGSRPPPPPRSATRRSSARSSCRGSAWGCSSPRWRTSSSAP